MLTLRASYKPGQPPSGSPVLANLPTTLVLHHAQEVCTSVYRPQSGGGARCRAASCHPSTRSVGNVYSPRDKTLSSRSIMGSSSSLARDKRDCWRAMLADPATAFIVTPHPPRASTDTRHEAEGVASSGTLVSLTNAHFCPRKKALRD